MVESAPPPVGRRIAALVAFVSLVASGVIFSVTLPKGLDDRPATEPVSGATTSSMPPKGGTATAVVVTQNILVTAGPVTDNVRMADGRTVRTRFLHTVTGHPLSLLSTDTVLASLPPNDLTDEEFSYLASEGRLVVETADGTVVSVGLGLRTKDSGKWWPLESDSQFGSVARLLDGEGNLVGIAVRDHSSTWAMKIGDLVGAINGPTGDGQGG